MNSTEPVVYTSEEDHRGGKGQGSVGETVGFTNRFIAQGSILLGRAANCILVNQGQVPASLENPYGGCSLLWSLEGTEAQHLYSLRLPDLAYADDGEVKFVGHEQGARIQYFGPDVDGPYHASTVQMLGSRIRWGIEFYAPPDRPEPWTTETVWIGRVPSTIDLGLDFAQLGGDFDLLYRLEAFRSCPDSERWPASEWPSEIAFADARAFIELLLLRSIPLPYLSLADDGEINLFWQKDGVHIDLGFYGTGTYSYFAHGKDGERLYGDDVSVSGGFPTALAGLFEG